MEHTGLDGSVKGNVRLVCCCSERAVRVQWVTDSSHQVNTMKITTTGAQCAGAFRQVPSSEFIITGYHCFKVNVKANNTG